MSIHKDSAEMIIAQIEGATNKALTQDEKDGIYVWQKGKALEQITSNYGWEVVLEMLRDYVATANEELVKLSPAKNKKVTAQHAIVHALGKLYENFVQDVQSAISAEVPECLVELIQSQSPALNP